MLDVSHKTLGMKEYRPQACVQLLCLAAEQLALNSQDGWLYMLFFYGLVQISKLTVVKTERFCHSFINTQLHLVIHQFCLRF